MTNGDYLPQVIVTDRDLALMNAIKIVFPTTKTFLFRWHLVLRYWVSAKASLRQKSCPNDYLELISLIFN